ncbi:MAG: UDP-N-acetylglucosamine 2-epimerase (non-hydrolyzing) [Chloroflexi bacterium]|nr:UDP-N-acetylglucosamine 2-epimerase (non-hydrolyzing) [Chloroflexota bacterium]
MKIAVTLGTRPEIVKLSPVIRELERRQADYYILHTGQHYSYHLDRVFFEQLELPPAKYNLEVGSGSHADQTAKILSGVEKILGEDRPDIVLALGDTNSVLAAAIAATKMHIKVGHIEAGLRSYDRTMPEEINRILTDHCADYLFAPTENSKSILLNEGIPNEKIFITGNTIVDAVQQNIDIADRQGDTPRSLNLVPKEYFLVTIHRQENVDNPERFISILEGLDIVAEEFRLPIVYPIHPRALKRLSEFNIKPRNLTLIEPIDFLSFLQLEKNARLLLTDSGGVQEEACILGVPCVTLRDNTERPETIDVGANILAGAIPETILECSKTMVLSRTNSWENPLGDGAAGFRIVNIVMEKVDDQHTCNRRTGVHRIKSGA